MAEFRMPSLGADMEAGTLVEWKVKPGDHVKRGDLVAVVDTDTILASVRRTRRAVIADEGWRTGSLSAEISAQIVEGAFYDLDAPVARVCTAEVPIPYPRHLEEAALPQPASIAEAARQVTSHG